MPFVDAETPDFVVGTLVEDAAEPLDLLTSGQISPDGTTFVLVGQGAADV